MARFTESQLNKLKTDISLVRLIQTQGYDLKKQGKEYIMQCPFHDDKTPSLKVSVEKNVFNCFGCDAKGTVIDWVIKTQGVSFRHACEILSHDAGMSLDKEVRSQCTVRKLESPIAIQKDNQTALVQSINYYHDILKQSPEAHTYLKSRGLTNPEMIDAFKLGFANRTLGLRLPHKNRVAGNKIRTQLQEIGIYRKSGHEHFNGSIVIPIINEHEQITEVYGRKICDKLRKGTPKHLYLPGPHKGVFNWQALKGSKEIILCESIIDALTFWTHGYRNVTTSFGTGGFTDDIMNGFKQYKTKRVLIAYDRDDAGNQAAIKLSKQLNKQGIDTFRILFPKNSDANEYALSVQPAAKSLGIVIRKAQWMGNAEGLTLKVSNKTAEAAGSGMTTTTQIIEKKELANQKIVDGKQKTEAEDREQKTDGNKAAQRTSSKKTIDSNETLLAAKDKNLNSLASLDDLPEPSATVMPSHKQELEAEISNHEINITLNDRAYRIRGMSKNMSYEQLKLNIHVAIGDRYYVDTFDMYHARCRASFIKLTGIELGINDKTIKKDLGQILSKLEELQEQQIKATLNTDTKEEVKLTEPEYIKAMELLTSPNLLEKITENLTTSGIIGEDINKLTGYLACVSRKLERPLAIIIQSTSAAGKSSLMDAILNFMPEEEMTQYSAMTGQSLFYMGETNLKNKILAIAEEEGAQNASYALKLLQSEGQLTIASTGKDDSTGNMVTKQYHVQGPVMLFMTTTAIDIDEELMNRCLVLTVNESRKQTADIHAMQRKLHTIEGLLQKKVKKQLMKLHQNAQRLIQPILVANPYAEQLTFIHDKTRTRRDHMKYLTLINSITLLHQHQREIQTIVHNGEDLKYIEVTKSDIAMANKLAHIILGRSLDELPPQTRKLLKEIHELVTNNCKSEGIDQCDYHFSRKIIRDATSWGNTQLKIHLHRLEDMEYLLVHKGGRGQTFVYELLYHGEDDNGKSRLSGLIDVEKLNYDENKSGLNSNQSVPSRPQVGVKSVAGRSDKITAKVNDSNTPNKINGQIIENVRLGTETNSNHRHSVN